MAEWNKVANTYFSLTEERTQQNIKQFYTEIMQFCSACAFTAPTIQAIAGIAGNIMRESTFNPQLIEQPSKYNVGWDEIRKGHGLIQWTGSSNGSNPLINWCKKILGSNYSSDSWHRSYELKVTKKGGAEQTTTLSISLQVLLIMCEGYTFNDNLEFKIKINNKFKSLALQHVEGWYKTSSYPYTWSDFCALTDINEAVKAYLNERERAGVGALQERLTNAAKCFEIIKTGSFTPRLENDEVLYDKPYWIATSKGGKNRCVARADFNSFNSGPNVSSYPYATADRKAKIKAVGSVLPNCTGYAWGRAIEVMGGEIPKLSTSNAGQWFNNKADGYPRGAKNKPQVGAIACWDNPGQAGHVAVVEQVLEDGKIIVSESGYNGGYRYPNYYWISDPFDFTKTRWGTYKPQGFIYLPCACLPGGYGGNTVFPAPRVLKVSGDKITIAINALGSETISKLACTIETLVEKKDETLTDEESNSVTVEIADLASHYQKESNSYIVTINQLVPLTKYRLYAQATLSEDSSNTLNSNDIFFKTPQSYPDFVENVSITSINQKKYPNSTFYVTFDTPKSWGYWKDNDKGYIVHFIVNNKIVTKRDNWLEYGTTQFYFKPDGFLDYPVKSGDLIQVGIQSWVKDDTGSKIFNTTYSTTPSIKLLENDFEIYIKSANS